MCGAKEGDHFTLEGEMLYLPPGQGISIYSLGAVLPLLAAKQRMTAKNDWMSTDAEVACPDPCCPSRLRIMRTGVRTFKHGNTTLVPLSPPGEAAALHCRHRSRIDDSPLPTSVHTSGPRIPPHPPSSPLG
ncbi:hypothetical protein V8D89_007698 [Ganoderma adspersum]